MKVPNLLTRNAALAGLMSTLVASSPSGQAAETAKQPAPSTASRQAAKSLLQVPAGLSIQESSRPAHIFDFVNVLANAKKQFPQAANNPNSRILVSEAGVIVSLDEADSSGKIKRDYYFTENSESGTYHKAKPFIEGLNGVKWIMPRGAREPSPKHVQALKDGKLTPEQVGKLFPNAVVYSPHRGQSLGPASSVVPIEQGKDLAFESHSPDYPIVSLGFDGQIYPTNR